MNIQYINNNIQKNYTLTHKGVSRTVYKQVVPPDLATHKYGNIKHKNTSWMFRPELWNCIKIYKYFSRAFNDATKVNVYNYGCSLGYEAYSFVLWLLSGKKKNPEKFLPIIAKDYDEFIINEAKKNNLFMNIVELGDIETVAGYDNIHNFFELSDFGTYNTIDGIQNGRYAKPKTKLTDNVQFYVADIREDYKNIEPENSIVIATNFWPYLEREERYELANNLYKQLDKGSYVNIADFDNNQYYLRDNKSTAEILHDAGFKQTSSRKILKK